MTAIPPPNPNQTGKPPTPGAASAPEAKPKPPPRKRARALSSSTDKPILAPGTHWLSIEGEPVHQTMEQFAVEVWDRMHYLGMRTKAMRDAVAAQSMRLNVMRFYRRGGVLGVIDERACKFVPVSSRAMRLHIERWIPIESWPKPHAGCAPEVTREVCRIDWAEAVIEHPNIPQSESAHHVHELAALAPHPIVLQDGTVYAKPTMLESAQAVWVPRIDLSGVEAVSLWDLLADFPIPLSSYGNMLAAIYTPMLRPMLPGNVPLFCITAPVERTGKTKLYQDVIGEILLGGPAPLMQWPKNEDEVDKRILALGLQGETICGIDNVPSKLDSAALASLVTSRNISGRILGLSQYASMVNLLTLYVTANHLECSPEISKRSVVIYLQPAQDNPELRTGFKYPDLIAALRANRLGLLKWLLDGVERWRVAGCPAGSAQLGGFESWARSVGGLCEFLGYPVLANRADTLVRMDDDTADLRKFVPLWWEVHKEELTNARELLALATMPNLNVWQGLLGASKNPSYSLSRKLGTYDGRTIEGFRIERLGSGSERMFRLVRNSAG